MNRKPKVRRSFGILLVLFMCLAVTSAPLRHYAAFPNELRLFQGQAKDLHFAMPVHAQGTLDPSVAAVNGSTRSTFPVNLNEPVSIQPKRSGETELRLKLFGKIPFKTVKLQVVPDLKVVPGGQTIGVKVKSAGIMVVGHHLVQTGPNTRQSPGEDAKLKLGDLIVAINGKPLNDVSKVASLADEAGKSGVPLQLDVRRGKMTFKTKLSPAFDQEDQAWRLGLYIRDSAAGVGTLTFYAPDQGVYGALGHVITDMDTQTPISVGSGQILQSNVLSISKSQSGEPGEKRATFIKEGKTLGNVERNTPFGIFGRMNRLPEHALHQDPVPVAFSEEVEEGPAEILTVVNGQKVERFNIQIVHVSKQTSPATKGMVIRITDPKLLERTGGIVQGMSGSPILQNGKLVGAVTHVFVNDPTSGYGCFIEWMLQDAGIMLKPEEATSKAV
ncbi:SpoIVB peptidase [Cohnella xylanilytica]|uniref:SpoIVB peptidase n=1 Tax=Cohnella xylanilytica TaxID=557555 RepID=A0A841U0L7_9BACL|nr:SpoIVB peptidase [Cohnella xylanilytica]MBB6692952.1 SpoIVB peptidase [Cohnella xylanilytica]GIO11795.1 SpoIVB peptidase [Cohnella xylanilytica]